MASSLGFDGQEALRFDPADPHQYAWLEDAAAWHYIEGYEEAVRVLLEYVESEEGHLSTASDRIVYPLVFLCRQAVELRLKAVIKAGNRCLGLSEPSTAHKHNLHKLWNSARTVVLSKWPGMAAAELKPVEQMSLQLHAVDGSGTAFRYAESAQGGRSLPSNLKAFNLRLFVEQMAKVLEDLDAAAFGIEAEYEQQMEYESDFRSIYGDED